MEPVEIHPLEILQLRDIHFPGSPDFWPPALIWWLLLSLVFFVSLWIFIKLRRINKEKRRHQVLLKKVEELEYKLRKEPSNKILAEFNILLRQLAVAYYPRSEIASLTGGDWLHFLDKSGNTQDFSKGSGRILMDAPYRSGSLQNLNIDEFIPLIESWILNISENRVKGGGVSFE